MSRRVGKAYGLDEKEIEMLMPENYRRSSPNYDPDKYRSWCDIDTKQQRIPTFVRQ